MNRIVAPGLNDSIIGWIYNESYRQLWKVNRWCDFEDLVQDGLVLALKCRQRYGTELDPPHFLALLKTAFYHHIVDLQRRSGVGTEFRVPELDETFNSEQDAFVSLRGAEFPDQEFACALSELPEPIKAVLRLFLSQDNLRRLQLPLRATLNDTETPAKRLKRLAGWPEDQDFASELEKHLFPG